VSEELDFVSIAELLEYLTHLLVKMIVVWKLGPERT